MKALPGPAPAPRSSGGCGRAGVGSDIMIPIAVFPGLPLLFANVIGFWVYGWIAPAIILGSLALFIVGFMRWATKGQRIYARADRFWSSEAARRTSPTVHHTTPVPETAQPWLPQEAWDACVVTIINEHGEKVEIPLAEEWGSR